MKFSDDNQMTIGDLAFNSEDEIDKLDENINKLKVCSRRNSLERSPIQSPSSSKGNGKCGRPANPIPRHKRDSHIKAEHKRRDKIQKGFDVLREMVPALENCSAKESKSSMLFKTAEYCRQLKVDCKAQQDEALALHHEIESLGNQIHALQGKLPAVGIDVKEKTDDNLDLMFNRYVKRKSKDNWKFWMFSYLVKPLFDSYKKTMEGMTSEVFLNAVGKWVEENMSLVKLRPAVLLTLRKVSTKTGIMEKPENFQNDVIEIITRYTDENKNNSSRLDAEAKVVPSPTKPEQSNHLLGAVSASDHHLAAVTATLNTTAPQSLTQQVPYQSCQTDAPMKNNSSEKLTELKSHPFPAINHGATTMPLNFPVIPVTGAEGHIDEPMTSTEFMDIPGILRTNDSSSSLSDIVFTAAEEKTLFDSILNSLHSQEVASHDHLMMPSLNDLPQDLLSLNNASTTTTSSSDYPHMATSHDIPVEMLPVPTFSDLDLIPTMEASMDHVSFLLDMDSKDTSSFHSNNTSSFPGL